MKRENERKQEWQPGLGMSGKGWSRSGGLSGSGGLVLGFEAKVLGGIKTGRKVSKAGAQYQQRPGVGLRRKGWGSEIPERAEEC